MRQYRNMKQAKPRYEIFYKYHIGLALPLVLLVLLATSLIVSITMKISIFDEDLGRQQADKNISKQMAELALSDARDDIMCTVRIDGSDRANDTASSSFERIFNYKESFDKSMGIAENTCANGLCGKNDTSTPLWLNLATASSSNLGFATYGQFTGKTRFGTDINGTTKLPRYIIETIQTNFFTGSSSSEYLYRITAVGYGRYNSSINTKLQIIYRSYKQTCGYNPLSSRNNS